uniref:Putative structural protein n=1 Tax=viral metagenome TaxID=1070528 RepID=A0A6M3LK78_9ZZZZ
MSIVVEDGTGLATAESYISVADASTYFTARGNTTWDAIATDALREAYLRQATEYMISTYRRRWQGVRLDEDQALDWPRDGVVVDSWEVDNDSVPTIIERACAELALKASSAELQPDLTQGVLSEQVGVIKVEYDRNSPQATRFKAIEAMLAPFLKSGGGASMGLIRS